MKRKKIAECYKFFSTDIRVVARRFFFFLSTCIIWKCICFHLKMATT